MHEEPHNRVLEETRCGGLIAGWVEEVWVEGAGEMGEDNEDRGDAAEALD